MTIEENVDVDSVMGKDRHTAVPRLPFSLTNKNRRRADFAILTARSGVVASVRLTTANTAQSIITRIASASRGKNSF